MEPFEWLAAAGGQAEDEEKPERAMAVCLSGGGVDFGHVVAAFVAR